MEREESCTSDVSSVSVRALLSEFSCEGHIAPIMVKSSWDDADSIRIYYILLFHKSLHLHYSKIINVRGSYCASPPPESMLAWVGACFVLCAADIPTLIRGGNRYRPNTFGHDCMFFLRAGWCCLFSWVLVTLVVTRFGRWLVYRCYWVIVVVVGVYWFIVAICLLLLWLFIVVVSRQCRATNRRFSRLSRWRKKWASSAPSWPTSRRITTRARRSSTLRWADFLKYSSRVYANSCVYYA